MSLSLKKRGRNYYAEGRLNGQRVHQSLKTRDVQVARALLRDLEVRLLSGGRLGTKAWSEFADEFMGWIKHQVKGAEDGEESTLSRYDFVVRRFSKFLEEGCVIELEHVDSAVLAKYSENRLLDVHPKTKKLATAKTVKSDLRTLHRIFSYALQIHRACLTPAQQESSYVFSKPDGTPLKRTALTATLLRLFARCGIKGGHPHRFRDTFAVRVLEQGASLYDVAKLLGINVATAEAYYSPYCKELQERGARLVRGMRLPVSPENFETANSGKVVTFR